MASPIRTLAIIRYYRDRPGWDCELVPDPDWPSVDAALRRMDDFCFPIVLLSLLRCESGDEAFEDEDAFNVVGGSGRFALFQMTGPWKYIDPRGSRARARLWMSDQGYFCEEREVLTDVDLVLRIVRTYFETGGYESLPS